MKKLIIFAIILGLFASGNLKLEIFGRRIQMPESERAAQNSQNTPPTQFHPMFVPGHNPLDDPARPIRH